MAVMGRSTHTLLVQRDAGLVQGMAEGVGKVVPELRR